MSQHPNATASIWTTGLAWVILHTAHHFGYLEVKDDQALAAVGGLIAIRLWVGKRGIWPALKGLWLGTKTTVVGKPAGK